MYQIKAVVRAEKIKKGATSAKDALRVYREMQTQSGLKSCAVFQKGVLLSQTDLEQAARREQYGL